MAEKKYTLDEARDELIKAGSVRPAKEKKRAVTITQSCYEAIIVSMNDGETITNATERLIRAGLRSK